jgi:adenosylhomocysteine nucleosidase
MSGAGRISSLPLRGWSGMIGATDVWVVLTGMGIPRAALTAMAVLDVREPGVLLAAGVAGALDPDLKIGDVISATEVVAGRDVFVPSVRIPAARQGRLLSIDQVLTTAEEKQEAWTKHGSPRPLAVEMETVAIAAIAKKMKVRWAALRAISDTASVDLPLDFNRLRTEDGDLPPGRVARAVLRQPGAIPGLLRLGANTNRAGTHLAATIAAWLAPGQ